MRAKARGTVSTSAVWANLWSGLRASTLQIKRGTRERPVAYCRLSVVTLFGRILCFVILSLLPQLLTAQQVKDFPEVDLPTLANRAEIALQSNPSEAILYMVEIKRRLSNAMSEEFRAIYRENLYRLGLAHMRWYELTENAEHLAAGLPFWDEFIQEFLADPRHPLATINRADSYFGAKLWDKALDEYLSVLRLYSLQLDQEELYGVLQRLVFAAGEAERNNDTIETLERYLDADFSEDIRLFALNTLFDRGLEVEGLDPLMRLVAEINRDRRFRYDLGINLRLLNTGDRFDEAEKYLEAGLLFSMVLPLERLLYEVEDRLIAIEEQLFRAQFIASKAELLVKQLDALREQRLELIEAPKYTANLRWRQARVLRLMGRTYEAFFAFVRVIDQYPQHKHIEQFRYAAFLQAIECAYLSEAIAQGEVYLANPAYIEFEKSIAVQLSRLYERQGDVEKVTLLADEFLHRFPYDPVATQMAHSLGQALFKVGDTELILDTLPFWREEYPDGAFVESVDYWTGMAYLFTGDFERALRAFESLIESNPGSIYYLEARFRCGVAHFGMGDYSVARGIITDWLSIAPSHALEPEAHVFLGDLDAMDAKVESALANYAKVEALGASQALIDHAYFESASLLIANQRFADHDELLERYLDCFPESPAAAEAVLRLAEANLEQGRIRKAFAYYGEGIERFGHVVATDHVDQLIDAWWTTDSVIRQRHEQTLALIDRLLSDEVFRARMLFDRVAQIAYFKQHPHITQELQDALLTGQPLYEGLIAKTNREADSAGDVLDLLELEALRVIKRRIDAQLSQLPEAEPSVIFAQMRADAAEKKQAALALRLLRILNLRADFEVTPVQLGQNEVDLASPATLVWIAQVEGQEDPMTARRLLQEVIKRAPGTDAAANALFELGLIEMELAYFDQAADYFAIILEDYFGGSRTKQAAMFRGDSLRSARRYDDAVAAYTLIINQRDWRGVLWAEATFKIGLCFLELNQKGKAQGFFERTYLAYAGYPEWSAKAVLESGELLEGKGETESARKTYQFFLDLPRADESPLYQVIRQRAQSL